MLKKESTRVEENDEDDDDDVDDDVCRCESHFSLYDIHAKHNNRPTDRPTIHSQPRQRSRQRTEEKYTQYETTMGKRKEKSSK